MQQETRTLAKLSVPAVAAAVRRERLLSRIEDAGPAVWIAAPPGAGKTTLAASYVGASKCPRLWYRIDAGDTDPAAFFYFLGLAAAAAAPRRRIALPLLTPEYLPDLAGFARRFFRTLFERLPAGGRLVFDNYHELDGVPAFHDIMREALSEIPAGFKVLVASRSAPPPALSRLTANRELELLDWEDLRLTPAETHALVGAVDEPTALRLYEQSGGWTAGVILLMRHSGGGAAMGLRSLESVFNYFAGEIFSHAPEDVRRLLIRTAFFPDFTLAMAERLVAGAAARDVLGRLCRQHCFVDFTGGTEGSYRYHDLFRDFLRVQAGDEAPACRSAAAEVLAAAGRGAEAIPLLLENGDWEAAAGLILGQARRLVGQGRWQTLRGWIDMLPHATTAAMPWLLYWQGISNFVDNPTLGRSIVDRAFEHFAAADDKIGQLLAASAIVEATFLEWADFAPLDRWIGVLETLLNQLSCLPSAETEIRVRTSMLSAMAYRQPGHPLLGASARHAMALLAADIDDNQKAFAATHLLQYLDWMGDHERAQQTGAVAQRLVGGRRLTPLHEVWLLIMTGHGCSIRGDHASAVRELDRALEVGNAHGLTLLMAAAYLARAVPELATGNAAAARTMIEKAEALTQPSRHMDVALLYVLKSWLALREGKTALAVRHAAVSVATADATASPISMIWSRVSVAQALTAAGDLTEAGRRVAEAERMAVGLEDGLFRFHIDLLRADLLLHAGDRADGQACLRRALATGARNGYADNLQWRPTMMAALCAEALRADIEPDYACWLIAKRGLRPPAADVDAWPWPLKIRALGSFDILRDGVPLEFPRKTPKKPIALLKALVALGGCGDRGVPEARLIDALWPDGDAAADALAVNLYRLRKLLGAADVIQVQGGRVGLNPERCWADAWAFERLTERADEAAKSGRLDECIRHSTQVLALYRGNFLADEVDETWMVSMRERLRVKFIKHVATMAKLFCQRKECEQAIACCQRGIDTDGLIEAFYQELMRCHLCRGRSAEGLAVYRRMRQTLAVMLGIAPSAASEALYRKLRSA